MSVRLLLTSALEKVRLDQAPAPCSERFTVLKEDQFSFQAAFLPESDGIAHRADYQVIVSGPLSGLVQVRYVEQVPVRLPAFDASDGLYLDTRPGLYPDLLRPLYEKDHVPAVRGQWTSLWIEVRTTKETPAGTYPLTLSIRNETEDASLTAEICVMNAVLPEQRLKHTEWFHMDGLSSYYHEPVFSPRFMEIVRAQIRTAVRRGINMLLTPLWTPPLDTRVGSERLTAQLLDIEVGDGQYRFSFDRLRDFMNMAREEGIRYFEMSHLFTQWGAKCCPKIIATVDGKPSRIFGWDTPATGDAYRGFLEALLPELTAQLKSWGYGDCVYFHISDEPSPESLPQYKACRAMVEHLLAGFPIMDAMSDHSFFEQGICRTPVVATNHLTPFLEDPRPDEFWVYYCCGQGYKVSNRFIAMPSWRTRILGVQLYKFAVDGFLQWGYNYYNNVTSIHPIDPFATTDGEASYPAGDPFVVYPGPDGEPLESLRLVVLSDALCDLRALTLLETLTSRDHVLSLIEDGLEEPLSFEDYPHSPDYLLSLRRRVNEEIEQHL